jgi:hypothetical protein
MSHSGHSLASSAGDISYWRALCPELAISPNPFDHGDGPLGVIGEVLEAAVAQIRTEGYFQMPAMVPADEVQKIARAIKTVVEAGYPASFVLIYDEIWQMLDRLQHLLAPMLGESFTLTRDVWIYYVRCSNEAKVASKEDSGWGPHRDGHTNITTLREDGSPQVLNLWIPFVDITTSHSCMHVLPTHLDPNYPENLGEVSVPVESLQDIRALPAPAGSVLGWNEYALHWGSRGTLAAESPRISMTARVQSRDTEPVDINFLDQDTAFGFEERLGVIATVIQRYRQRYECPATLQDFCQKRASIYKAVELVRRHKTLERNA